MESRPRKRAKSTARTPRESLPYKTPRAARAAAPPAPARRPAQGQPKSTVGKRMGFATPSVSALANVKANPAYRNPAGGTLGTATHPANDPTGARARLISPSGTGKRQGPGKVPGVTSGDVLRAAARALSLIHI